MGLPRQAILAMPKLRIILAMGAGFENIDLEAAADRGIVVANGAGTNSSSVADHAIALALAALRGITVSDAAIRAGRWSTIHVEKPILTGKRVGIIGLGEVGAAVARRVAGFEVAIGYYNRKPRSEFAYRYYGSAVDLAANSDVLIISCPGGKATYHLVDHEVLHALGSSGFLVNVARGQSSTPKRLYRLSAWGRSQARQSMFSKVNRACPLTCAMHRT